jgi:dephospho-CoA kinase
MQKTIILIVGLSGSGKSFAAEVLKKKFKAKMFETGDIIREEIKRRGLEYTPENDRKMRLWFHPAREHLLMLKLWRKIKGVRGLIVIDGFKSIREVRMLKRLSHKNIVIIAIIASFKVRAEREIKRGRFGKQETIDYLRRRDISELRIGEGRLIKKADFYINNSNLTKKQFEKKIIDLIKKIFKQ